MTKTSLRRISLMGLVLMAASAATAALVSNDNKSTFEAGSLTAAGTTDGPAGKGTCTATDSVQNACNASTDDGNTSTTVAMGNASDDGASPTANNTTQVDS